MKRTERVETLVWLLIYVGLLSLVLGLFVAREESSQGGVLGAALMVAGAAATLAGVALIVVRSRMKNEGDAP